MKAAKDTDGSALGLSVPSCARAGFSVPASLVRARDSARAGPAGATEALVSAAGGAGGAVVGEEMGGPAGAGLAEVATSACAARWGRMGGVSVAKPRTGVAASGADAAVGVAKTRAGFAPSAVGVESIAVAVLVAVAVAVTVVATGAREARGSSGGIGAKRQASGGTSIPPARPAKRGEGWGEGPC
jgi:hypothetical protein